MIPMENYRQARASDNLCVAESYKETSNTSSIIGEFEDTFIYADGRRETKAWRKNLIVSDFGRLLAALCKGHPGYAGIGYWEVGSGLPAWDNAIPAPQVTDVALTTPLARVPVAIYFLDSGNNRVDTVTNKIEMEATFDEVTANGALREFGVFGGNSTEILGTGIMCDRVIHQVVNKTANMTLVRKLRFTF